MYTREQSGCPSVRLFDVGFYHSPSSASLPSPSARFAVYVATRENNASSCLGEAMARCTFLCAIMRP